MKRYTILLTALVLTAALFTGCGCTNQNMDTTSAPTVLPTNEEVWTNAPTVAPTTRATTEATMPTTGDTTESGMNGHGNGALEDAAGATGSSTEATENAAAGRARRMIPGVK